ncbi:hypothetical protein CYLTODRAFT_455835 [Cylindrobasidium torrendii FP15055 ss-10]|uniref:Uncharacterized protein n=1 Tax=Cylindrobasidium torrendii FP15055 ss-10 TaxID=1314674 RepID=A0A0D7B618_9AGAR|nr:hypothetical protein CYLTODRAFT_455835 [Cylindrobasidium torrendii FP15055 ss-10]
MSNTSDAQFKKTHQEVNRPTVTDHNINEEYMKTGPLNDVESGRSKSWSGAGKEKDGLSASELADLDLPAEGLGRPKKAEVDASFVQK